MIGHEAVQRYESGHREAVGESQDHDINCREAVHFLFTALN